MNSLNTYSIPVRDYLKVTNGRVYLCQDETTQMILYEDSKYETGKWIISVKDSKHYINGQEVLLTLDQLTKWENFKANQKEQNLLGIILRRKNKNTISSLDNTIPEGRELVTGNSMIKGEGVYIDGIWVDKLSSYQKEGKESVTQMNINGKCYINGILVTKKKEE